MIGDYASSAQATGVCAQDARSEVSFALSPAGAPLHACTFRMSSSRTVSSENRARAARSGVASIGARNLDRSAPAKRAAGAQVKYIVSG